jgi:hypothetical protein
MKNNLMIIISRTCLLLLLVFNVLDLSAGKKEPAREFYQLTVYHFKTDTQEKVIDNYLQQALLPALHKLNIGKVGVFKPLANDTATDKILYVFIPGHTLNGFSELMSKLSADAAFQTAGKEYIDADHATPPYSRMETILLYAFPLAPQMQSPKLQSPLKERVYELRSYESPTEKFYHNKVQMFNQGGEVDLFKRLNFNAVFYAEVIAGCKMPNLMYMTTFENMQDRDAHWKTFGDDPFWKKLSSMPEYQNNVSHADIILMHPTKYSDL